MLTIDVLKQNDALKVLADEQLKAIETMSANDEEQVIGRKTGEIYGGLEKDIKEVSGIDKVSGEKAYTYAKRIISHFKQTADSIPAVQQERDTLKNEITVLQAQISSGKGNEAIEKQLNDLKTQISQKDTLLNDLKSQLTTKLSEKETEIKSIRISGVLDSSIKDFKLKDTIPESARRILIDNAKSTLIKKFSPDMDEKGNIIFRREDGTIMLNPANNNNPISATDLLKLELKEVIQEESNQGGAGTGDAKGKGNLVLSLTGVKTQTEADDVIVKMLMDSGIARGTKKFADEKNKLWLDNNISKLPIS